MTNQLDEKSVKFLTVKSNVLMTKLKSTYPDILLGISTGIPDQLIIQFKNWPKTHIYVNIGSRGEESAYIIYSINKQLEYYGILSENANKQIEEILTIINFINGKIIL